MMHPMILRRRRISGSGGGGGGSAWPSSAVLAYSVARVMNPDYAGNLIRVRRSSDNAEADIGAASGVLDETALLAHCGAGDGYVVKVYEQSGDANAVDFEQTTAGLQPQIVSSGAVVKMNGVVAAYSPTVGTGREFLTATAWNTRPSDADVLMVMAANQTYWMVLSAATTNWFLGVVADTTGTTSKNAGTPVFYGNSSLIGTEGSIARADLFAAYNTNTLLVARVENVSFAATAADTIRTEYTQSTSLDGPDYFTELVVIASPAAGETAALEAEQATAYGITLA